jgi:hypothetical protein
MHIILCLLLYLQLIVSPGTYTSQQINDLETANDPIIMSIEQDPDLLSGIEQFYNAEADQIVIIDTTED